MIAMTEIAEEDLADLRTAKVLLENPGLAARMTNVVGAPIEKGLAMLPEGAHDMIMKATRKALETALDVAVSTLNSNNAKHSSGRDAQGATNWLHKTVAGMTGAAGGAFGLPALAIELPVSTTIILRSIADIARSEGEDISDPDVQMACLAVFALGGPSPEDDAVESGYFAVRTALAKSLSNAAEYVTRQGVTNKSAPVIVQMVGQIASRFGVPVTQKTLAQSVPLVGAAGGALINTLFIDHFQSVSRGHFIVRRLERKYGAERVKLTYERLDVVHT